MDAIRTERVLIRPFVEGDLEDFLAYQSDPQVRRHLPGEPQTPADAARYLTRQSTLDDRARDVWHDWAIQHLGDGIVIGNIGVFLPAGDLRTADLGFQLHPAYQGQGLAGEAAAALVRHLAASHALTSVTASCDVENQPSACLLLRLGMTEVTAARTGSRSFELRVGDPAAPGHRPGI